MARQVGDCRSISPRTSDKALLAQLILMLGSIAPNLPLRAPMIVLGFSRMTVVINAMILKSSSPERNVKFTSFKAGNVWCCLWFSLVLGPGDQLGRDQLGQQGPATPPLVSSRVCLQGKGISSSMMRQIPTRRLVPEWGVYVLRTTRKKGF